jgi:hypothetical protein
MLVLGAFNHQTTHTKALDFNPVLICRISVYLKVKNDPDLILVLSQPSDSGVDYLPSTWEFSLSAKPSAPWPLHLNRVSVPKRISLFTPWFHSDE